MAPIRARTKLTNTGSQNQSKGIARGLRPLARLKVSTHKKDY